MRKHLFSRWLVLFFVALLLLGAGSTVGAQEADSVILKADAGFDGYVDEDKWMPVHISVENKGADIEGSIEVKFKGYSGADTLYSAEVSLPANSRKEFFIYAFFGKGSGRSVDVSLVSENKVITKSTLRVVSNAAQSIIVGVLSNSPSKFTTLNRITMRNGLTRMVQIDPSMLPDLEQGWEALDLLVIDDIDSGLLTSEQQKALELWLAKGGTLLVIGGPKWQSSTVGVSEFLPIQVSGTVTTSMAANFGTYLIDTESLVSLPPPEEAEVVLATGTLTKDADVLATQGEYPLLIQKQIGRGKSIFFAADPGLAPYNNWLGLQAVYQNLFGLRPPPFSWENGHWDIYSSNEALTTIAVLDVPSIFFICGCLGLYVFLVGPLNYIVLRVLKKREWAWVTIPAIVVVVSVVAYVYGYLYRGNSPTLNRLTVVQAWDGVSQAESHSLIGIYSPQRQRYTLEAEKGFLLYPFDTTDLSLQNTASWTSTQQGQAILAPEIPIEIGGMKIVGAQGTTSPLQFKNDLTIKFENGRAMLIGTITNDSKETIYDAAIVTPGQWNRLNEISPGEKVNIRVAIVDSGSGPEFYNIGSMGIMNLNYPVFNEDEDIRRKEAFLRALLSVDYNESNFNWGIYLMGWLVEKRPIADLQDQITQITDTTYYIHQLSPAVSLPEATIVPEATISPTPDPNNPGGFVTPATGNAEKITLTTAMFKWLPSEYNISPYYIYGSGFSEYSMTFRPAIDLAYTSVDSLSLQMDSYRSPSDFEISLWDYTLQAWVVVDSVNWGNMKVPEPEKYVNQNGEIRLKVKDKQSGYLELSRSAITLTVIP